MINAIVLKISFILVIIASTSASLYSQDAKTMKDEARAQWILLSKTGEPHALLSTLNGNWTFTGKHLFAGPGSTPFVFNGFFRNSAIWGGRYFIGETISNGKMKMPWSGDSSLEYEDKWIEGYDNVKKKYFLHTYHNEASTGIIAMEGVYDEKTKTITYETETTAHMHSDIMPGIPFRITWSLTFTDKDHFLLVAKETVKGKPVVTTEITYTRVKTG